MPATTRGGGEADETDIRCYSCHDETVIRFLGSREDDMKPFDPPSSGSSS
jgi:hypothetical protein